MAAFRLAVALGAPDPYALVRAMPARLFREWLAYQALEPWRTADEPARVYPLPSREQLGRKFERLKGLLSGLQHRQR